MPRVHRRAHNRQRVPLDALPIFDLSILRHGFLRGRPGQIVRNDADCIEFYRNHPDELHGTYAETVALGNGGAPCRE